MRKRPFSIGFFTLGIVGVAGVAGATVTPTSCSSSTSCAVFQNSSSGPAAHTQGISGYGLRSNSSTGGGLLGTTASGNLLAPGVEGESTNQSGNDVAGGFGLSSFVSPSTAPEYGVYATGSQTGVAGATVVNGQAGIPASGVAGFDSQTASFNAGVLGNSTSGVGVIAAANGAPDYTNLSYEPIGLFAVGNRVSKAHDGLGAVVQSDDIALLAMNTIAGSEITLGTDLDMIDGVGSGGGQFYFDNAGNEFLSGTLTTSSSTTSVTKGDDGSAALSYGERSTVPQIEDIGSGQIVNGRGYVRIDRSLHHVIDGRIAYHVFLTPAGDCNGLFVADRTPDGFAVRELRGGRSTLSFDYRIVAKPFDDNGARLARATPRLLPETHLRATPARTTAQSAAFRSPIDRLRAKLGPAAFARALRDFEARENAK